MWVDEDDGALSEVLISRMKVGVEGKVRQAEDLYFTRDIAPVKAVESVKAPSRPASQQTICCSQTGEVGEEFDWVRQG